MVKQLAPGVWAASMPCKDIQSALQATQSHNLLILDYTLLLIVVVVLLLLLKDVSPFCFVIFPITTETICVLEGHLCPALQKAWESKVVAGCLVINGE